MEWELLGYKDYPFSVNPISINTLELFTGHSEEIRICQNILSDRNIRLVIEGARGVGTTSFANYLKFAAQKKNQYLAPREEVSVQKNWNLESLLTAVISTVIRELDITHEKEVKKNKIFVEAKSLSYRLSEAYNSYGITAFSVGGSYGRTSAVTQPTFVPSTTLGHHLRDLGTLAVKLGFKNGILIQLNNLDLNAIHTEEHLEYLFNAARDYFQIENVSWFLVGDVGLRSFIARRVDRLDDIISDTISIKPLTKSLYHDLIDKRFAYYQTSKRSTFPIEKGVFDYLYDLTDGRLRYIFGLIYAITNRLHLGKLVQMVSIDLAKDTITTLAQERIQKFNLTKREIELIRILAKQKELSVIDLAEAAGKDRTTLSRMVNKLLADKLVDVKQQGKQRIFFPSLDAKIAFLQ